MDVRGYPIALPVKAHQACRCRGMAKCEVCREPERRWSNFNVSDNVFMTSRDVKLASVADVARLGGAGKPDRHAPSLHYFSVNSMPTTAAMCMGYAEGLVSHPAILPIREAKPGITRLVAFEHKFPSNSIHLFVS